MPEFSPEQLTQLEDGLESIDRTPGPELERPVSARLEEYAQVVAATRVAWPEEVPSPGVLDGVVAEARSELSQAPPAIERTASARARWWFPTFALAGAAALVLLFVLIPDRADEATSRATSELARAQPRPGEPNATFRPLEREKAESVPAVVFDDVREERVATPALPQAGAPPATAQDGASIGGALEPTARSASGSSRSRGLAEGMPSSGLAQPTAAPRGKGRKKAKRAARSAGTNASDRISAGPSAKPSAADELAPPAIEQAHALRRNGQCPKARKLYRRVLEDAADQGREARAQAGLGLCLEREERDVAKRHLEAALRLDSSLRPWIDRERARTP